MSANPNVVHLSNEAALVVRFSLAYKEDGQDKSIGTGDMTVKQTRTERFPASVTTVKVQPSYHTGLEWENLPDVTVSGFPASFTFTGTLFNPDISVQAPPQSSTSSGAQGTPTPRKTTAYDLIKKYTGEGSLEKKLSRGIMAEIQGTLKAKSMDEVNMKLQRSSHPKELQDLLGIELSRKLIKELNA